MTQKDLVYRLADFIRDNPKDYCDDEIADLVEEIIDYPEGLEEFLASEYEVSFNKLQDV